MPALTTVEEVGVQEAQALGLPPEKRRKLVFHLHPGQQRAWESTARFILVLAGTQGGKTAFSPLWLHREILRQPLCGSEGEADYIAASATFDLLDLKLRPAMVDFFCRKTGWGEWQASKRLIRSRVDDSRIVFRSAEDPESLESMTGPAAVLDEFGQKRVAIGAWEAVLRRLSIRQGRALIPTTPYCLGWLYQQVYARWKGGDPDYDVISFKSIENPVFPVAEYERARLTLPAWKHAMFYDGDFRRPAGLIYGDYDDTYRPEGHLVKPFSIPAAWRRRVGVDFGGTEHTGLVWLAEEQDPEGYPTGCYIVYRTALGGGLSGAEHARAALSYQEPVELWVGGAKSEGQDRRTWGEAGVGVSEPRIEHVEPGIDRVVALFRQRRLFVMEGLTGLRSSLGTYSRELDDVGNPTMRIEDKERFHLLDALRYVCGTIPVSHVDDRPVEIPEQSRKLEHLLARAEQWRREELGPESEEYL